MKTNQKEVFLTIFSVFSILLLTLPFVVTANDLLTRIVEKNSLYIFIQHYIVPVEAKMIGVILMQFGYKFTYSPTNSLVVVNGITMGITWNCIGWQSFLLFFITLFTGLQGRFTKVSIIESLILGILGMFWMNIIRMLFTILLAVNAPPVFRITYHDYLAAISTIIFLFVFWWFSYAYVLEEKTLPPQAKVEKAQL